MRAIYGRNVNEIYPEGLLELARYGVRSKSRAGDVIVAPYPVVSVYEHPEERVLFDATRDANPFFHLMEGLWMLAGRDDAAFLNHYVSDFGARFAEDCGFIHGAYGARWRRGFGFDQLDVVVGKLRENPDDRQAVIAMWDAHTNSDDVGHEDLTGDFRDRPCNTHLYLRVRNEKVGTTTFDLKPIINSVLDLTICCRSNDIVWGAYGANAVHFSMLLEYLAGRMGVGIGRMYQFSNNYHGYVEMLDKVGEPRIAGSDGFDGGPYETQVVRAQPMATDWSTWDQDLRTFMRWHDWLWTYGGEPELLLEEPTDVNNIWFAMTAARVAQCRWMWKHGKKQEALDHAGSIEAEDWRRTCVEWMSRRLS